MYTGSEPARGGGRCGDVAAPPESRFLKLPRETPTTQATRLTRSAATDTRLSGPERETAASSGGGPSWHSSLSDTAAGVATAAGGAGAGAGADHALSSDRAGTLHGEWDRRQGGQSDVCLTDRLTWRTGQSESHPVS